MQDKAILPIIIRRLTTIYPGAIPFDLVKELETIHYIDLSDSLSDPKIVVKLWAAIDHLRRVSHKVQRIQLTRVERWILSNQFEILAALSPDDADMYNNMRMIVTNGYEFNYEDIAQDMYYDRFTMRRDQCLEVINIFDMFRSLQFGYEEVADKSDILKWKIEFFGFDGNTETAYMAYGRFIVENLKQCEWIAPEKGFNSHMPTLSLYRRMLEEWNKTADKYNLTRDDIIRIAAAWESH